LNKREEEEKEQRECVLNESEVDCQIEDQAGTASL
jgi:hypothetical protein